MSQQRVDFEAGRPKGTAGRGTGSGDRPAAGPDPGDAHEVDMCEWDVARPPTARERRAVPQGRGFLVRCTRHWQAVVSERRLFTQLGSALWPFVLATVAIGLTFTLGLVFLMPPALRMAKSMAMRQRKLLEEDFGIRIPVAYRPQPTVERLSDGSYRYGKHVRKTRPGPWELELYRLLHDPAIWRDVRWLALSPLLAVVAVAPLLLLAYGLIGQLMPALVWAGAGRFPTFCHLFLTSTNGSHTWQAGLTLTDAMIGGFALAPAAVHFTVRRASRLLSPPENARLELRVQQLTETRAEAVDTQAAELRRIERDLHDGVQARLVAMGLNLGAAEQLMGHDPAAAKALLAQSREASATALRELRGLVRGIHPPVLAERGLADAIKALALDSPLSVELAEDLPGRVDAPVESAMYFAVSELLTNAAKHAEADRVWIDVHHTGAALRVQVTDDGCGGADASKGSGLRGIERRLATFDGVLALSSPRGGPTIMTLELPCALSSPRTSTSSAKA